MDIAFLEFLGTYVSENKKRKMDKVLSMRTRHVAVVLENLHKPHNGSAVLRTCECFGIQDVYVVEQKNKYKTNPYVTRGSSKWIDIIKYTGEGEKGIQQCYEGLKGRGYTILATTPGYDSISLEEVKVDNKIALVLGNEFDGLSNYALQQADARISLPMHGFTESYNISVTAAICLYTLMSKLHQSDIPWKLTTAEKERLKLKWYKKALKHAETLERSFYREV